MCNTTDQADASSGKQARHGPPGFMNSSAVPLIPPAATVSAAPAVGDAVHAIHAVAHQKLSDSNAHTGSQKWRSVASIHTPVIAVTQAHAVHAAGVCTSTKPTDRPAIA